VLKPPVVTHLLGPVRKDVTKGRMILGIDGQLVVRIRGCVSKADAFLDDLTTIQGGWLRD
jgi:hypothetical protein